MGILKNLSRIAIACCFVFAACTSPPPKDAPGTKAPYPMRSYVEVAPMLDTLNEPLVFDLSSGKKRLVFIGCDHVTDSLHPQFARIGQLFAELRPQVAFNEGGQVREEQRYASVGMAAKRDGETGVNKFWCDRAGIELLNGDINDSVEFAWMGKRYSNNELYLYYMMERFFGPKAMGAYELGTYDSLFPKYVNWILPQKWFRLSTEERTYAHYKELFQREVGKPFNIGTNALLIEDFDYVNDNCRFCALGRSSKMIRDSVLLSRIEQAFDDNDRVLVTFGAGHALALESALPKLMERIGRHEHRLQRTHR